MGLWLGLLLCVFALACAVALVLKNFRQKSLWDFRFQISNFQSALAIRFQMSRVGRLLCRAFGIAAVQIISSYGSHVNLADRRLPRVMRLA
jgi:hypothetical protein